MWHALAAWGGTGKEGKRKAMTRVKICGIRSPEEAAWAVEAGADALGFVFHPASRRSIDKSLVRRLTKGIPAFVARVGVFVDKPREEIEETVRACGLTVVQLHGEERAEMFQNASFPIIKALKAPDPSRESQPLAASRFRQELEAWQGIAQAILIDSVQAGEFGGTGRTWLWEGTQSRQWLAEIEQAGFPLILAGGLTPGNVRQGIRQTRPYAVDVSSGVERQGAKDRDLIREFIQQVRKGLTLPAK